MWGHVIGTESAAWQKLDKWTPLYGKAASASCNLEISVILVAAQKTVQSQV